MGWGETKRPWGKLSVGREVLTPSALLYSVRLYSVAHVCRSLIGDEFLGGSATSFLDVVLEQHDGVKVGVEQ